MNQLRRLPVWTVLGVLAAVYIGVALVRTVHHNYQLQRQIGQLQQQLNNVQDEKDALRYKIQYYQTDSFKEKEARAKLGLQAPGEGVVILPHADDTGKHDATAAPTKKAPPRQSNWQQWITFLEGKTSR